MNAALPSRPSGAALPLVLLALGAVSCARRQAETSATGPNVVTITATDYAFALPDTLPAGLTELRLVNHGAEPHHAVVFRLAEAHPLDSVMAVLAAEGPPPPWLHFSVGPNLALPHDSTNATSVLEPGHYVVACFVSAPDGQMHIAKGMVRTFEVIGTVPTAVTEPTADVTIVMKDYGFDVTPALTAGTHTVRVENAGPQWHEVGIERLADGKTMADEQAWAEGGMHGPPPSVPVGGVIGPEVGGHAYFTVTLTPGKYLLTCYVPGPDGKPHVLHGMIQEIDVS